MDKSLDKVWIIITVDMENIIGQLKNSSFCEKNKIWPGGVWGKINGKFYELTIINAIKQFFLPSIPLKKANLLGKKGQNDPKTA